MADISVIDHSDEYYSIYGDISAKPGKKGTPIGKFDQLVAAIVIYHDAKLVTNNTKDFERVLSPSEIINH
ncbi:type II toxin-antitoxin system VapC family toxin [Methanoplanus limicola]|uniref:type II toxin-antitoxin system VapC family toxin n=1 Tax=Methanoplanus limicola TaxID=2315 RepID=UPI0006936187|nr:type II toxin-antitoxin system VapC family toxin [Methanoplanus limicola]